MTRFQSWVAVVSLCASALFFSGCATSFDSADSAPVSTSVGTINGSAYGGRQPIAGAKIYLLQARSGGDAGPGISATSGNASTDLLTSATGNGADSIGYYVLTDANGKFSITGDYTACTTGETVYLYSVGGNAGGGVNTAAGLMTALGTCGSFPFTSSTTINMNEVSTIAAGYAIAGFATDATHVGYSGTALARTGIQNAFANAGQLYDYTSNPYSAPNTVARLTTPGNGTNGGTGTVPQQQIDTLADILAMCINSAGASSSQCTALFTNGTNRLGTTATNTATQAIYMAQNPSMSVYNLVGTQPYSPYYNTAPANLSILLTFTGGGLTPGAGQGHGMEVDSSGNIWAVGVYSDLAQDPGTTLSKFSPLGVPTVTGGYTGIGLTFPNAVALDSTSSTMWIANYGTNSVIKYTISGGAHTSYSAGGSGVGTVSVSVDSAGDPWVSNTTTAPWVEHLSASNGSVVTTLANNNLDGTEAVAFNAGSHGDVWVANGSSNYYSRFTSSGSAQTSNLVIGQQTGGVVMDGSGNAWFGVIYTGVQKVNSAGTTHTYYAFGGLTTTADTSAITLDGAGNVWSANNSYVSGTLTDNTICALNNSGTNITGSAGYPPPSNSLQPNAIIVDLSGNVWYDTGSDSKLYELVGIAVPVTNPVSYATANSKLGQRP